MGLSLNRDGTAAVAWSVAGKDYRIELPTPTLAQFGDLMELADEVWDRLDEFDAEREKITAATADAKDRDDVEDLKGIRKRSRELEQEAREVGASRLVQAIRLLAPGPDAERFASDPPAWASTTVGFFQLVRHFNTVPFDGPAPEVVDGAGRQLPDATSS